MIDFYYQLKSKKQSNGSGFGRWAFPPIYSGKVTAKNRKEAKKAIEEIFDRELPLRVTAEQYEESDFLLSIQELNKDPSIMALFEERKCARCSSSFKIIDLYNNHFSDYKGRDHCSSECHEEHRKEQREKEIENRIEGMNGQYNPTIYKIENNETKKVYIGKTTLPFTFRWYQHFYQSGTSPFHMEIKNSKVTDWSFSVVEVIEDKDIPDNTEKRVYIESREAHWINHYDSINNGYNTMAVTSKINQDIEDTVSE